MDCNIRWSGYYCNRFWLKAKLQALVIRLSGVGARYRPAVWQDCGAYFLLIFANLFHTFIVLHSGYDFINKAAIPSTKPTIKTKMA